MFRSWRWARQTWVPGIGRIDAGQELKKADSRLAWSAGTKRWFRRRAWRTLRKLAELGSTEYAELAAGVLLAYTDDDARRPKSWTLYDYSSRLYSSRYQDAWAPYWAVNHILYGNSSRYEPTRQALNFRCVSPYEPGRPAPSTREESFPELWDRAPERLVDLLVGSRCAPVQHFAATALRANRPAWGSLTAPVLLGLLDSPYPATAELGADIAIERYDASSPDVDLVLAVASCGFDRARTTAHGWIRANRSFFGRHVDFVVAIALNPQADTRAVARDLLAAAVLSAEQASQVMAALFAAVEEADIEDADDALARIRDGTDLLLQAFSRELRSIDLDVIQRLLAHSAAGVQELGARLLVDHEIRPRDLPDTLLAGLLRSEFPGVRGVGMRLFGELPDSTLMDRERVLLHLCAHPEADLRAAVRPIIRRLAIARPDFAASMLAQLIAFLAEPEPHDGVHAAVVELMRDELARPLASITTDDVWTLLRSPEGVTQELGGNLLATIVAPADLEPAQIARLAGHDIQSVRDGAWTMVRAEPVRMKADVDGALKLLDNDWDDSRTAAFEWFESTMGPGDLNVGQVVAICDSIRPDVQQFGRKTITRFFEAEHGAEYLLKLSQHPAPSMQLVATNWLAAHAAGHPERLAKLRPYIETVLQGVNRGRVAKQRIEAFLAAEALASEASATVVAAILSRVAATVAVEQRAAAIATLTHIRARWPDVASPLTVRPPPSRSSRGV